MHECGFIFIVWNAASHCAHSRFTINKLLFKGSVAGPHQFAEGLAYGIKSLLGHTIGKLTHFEKIIWYQSEECEWQRGCFQLKRIVFF